MERKICGTSGTALELLSKYPLITTFCFDTMLCSQWCRRRGCRRWKCTPKRFNLL